jgi:hypothetical protein
MRAIDSFFTCVIDHTTDSKKLAGIDALVKALGPVRMARFLQQFDPGRGDYTIERDRIVGTPTVDELVTRADT